MIWMGYEWASKNDKTYQYPYIYVDIESIWIGIVRLISFEEFQDNLETLGFWIAAACFGVFDVV
jgi:hypothetical protein